LATAVNGLLTSEPESDVVSAVAAAAVKAAEVESDPEVNEPPDEPLVDSALEDGAEKVLLDSPPEKPVEEKQTAKPVIIASAIRGSDVAPPLDIDSKGGGLPGWIWWAGALVMLLIAAFGLRAILGGDTDPEPGPAEAPVVVEVTRVVTETITEEVEVTRAIVPCLLPEELQDRCGDLPVGSLSGE
jgi:hypothetical protein